MKIQIFTPYYPFPATEGAFLVVSEQAKRLTELGHEVELVYWKGEVGEKSPVATRRLPYERGPGPTPLRIARSLLSRWSSAELYHYPLNVELDGLPACDLRILHYSFASTWVSRLPSNAGKTVVFFHNLESDLYAQRARSESNQVAALIHGWNATKLRRHETDLIAQVDELWFLSPRDLRDFHAWVSGQGSKLRVFPLLFSEQYLKARKRDRKASAGGPKVGFVGGMHFRPNQLSAEWILDSVAPELEKRRFGGELWIAGKSPPPELLEKARRFPFVHVLGFVPDLSTFWSEVNYSLSPHVEGSGVRTKLWESIASGIPVLTHPSALEQISDELKGHPLLRAADSPGEWAEILCGVPAEAVADAGSSAAESWERLLKSPPAWFGA